MNSWIARVVPVVVILFLSVLSDSSGCLADKPGTSSIAKRLASSQATRIVCFGDSITGAYYHTGGERAWCDMLGFALQKTFPEANIEMINAGVSGHTTANALTRIDRDVVGKKPDLVVVMFGMNDVARIPIDDFRANLGTIARRCLENGSAVVLCTPNSVIENSARPNSKLQAFSEVVREIADQLNLPCVDVFQDWRQSKERDSESWTLMMSDEIHPNMIGHKRFASLIAEKITGKAVSVEAVGPSSVSLHHTFDRIHSGAAVKLVAMPPYDELLPAILREHYPDATFDVVAWPIENQSITQMAEWAKQIRALKPDLVVPAVPAGVDAVDRDTFVGQYEWVLNRSFQFAGRPWDVVPVHPSPEQGLRETKRTYDRLARQIMLGKDIRFIDRVAGDSRTTRELVSEWVSVQARTWRAARKILPSQNDHVHVVAQSWPQQPGPRTVKVSIHYPGGQLDQLNQQTGIMLTLHNWGGRDCDGTANPQVLADRLNVVAVCVNYLQSGPHRKINDAIPYDFGYLQALDALRALAFVRDGLKNAGQAYDDGRIFCVGGSGGGNVTLMANKLAPRTFACLIDICGMNKLSDGIAFNEPGGSKLNANWSRDVTNAKFLSIDAQELRFVGNPIHLKQMKRLGSNSKVVVVHGVNDPTCLFADAREMVVNMQSAGVDVDPHFIDDADLDGTVFTTTGHALGNRTEIVFRVAQKYLSSKGPDARRRLGPTDFELGEDIVYETTNGQYVIAYQSGVPIGRFVPRALPSK